MMASGVLVRSARTDDHAVIVELNTALAWESEHKTLDLDLLSPGVARTLAEPDHLRYWVAEENGRVIAQAAVSREWSDWRNGWLWWFQSVYVRPDWRRRGVLRAVFDAIRADARQAGDVVGLRLYVESANEVAQQTYRALGLKPGGYEVYEDIWTAGA